MANQRFGPYRSYGTIDLPASSACNDSAENWADARAPSCFKVQKSSRTARSRRHGLSFPDRGQVIFPGCAARAALKATLEKGLTERWIIGSNDVATIIEPGRTNIALWDMGLRVMERCGGTFPMRGVNRLHTDGRHSTTSYLRTEMLYDPPLLYWSEGHSVVGLTPGLIGSGSAAMSVRLTPIKSANLFASSGFSVGPSLAAQGN
jgi:hypothetical protein